MRSPITNETEGAELFAAVIELLRELRARKMEIRTFQSTGLMENEITSCNRHFKNHSLLLQKPDLLHKKFHRTCVRQKIARAEKSEFTLKKAESESDIFAFHRLYSMTRQKLGLPAQPPFFFLNLWKIFAPSGKVEVIFAVKDGKNVASLFNFRFKNRVSAEYLGWDSNYSEMSPNHFLFWETIKSAYADGFEVFDFGRTSPQSASLMDFKSRWGTQVNELPQVCYPRQVKTAAGSRSFMIMNKLCLKSPDFIYPLLGNFCYRHLG